MIYIDKKKILGVFRDKLHGYYCFYNSKNIITDRYKFKYTHRAFSSSKGLFAVLKLIK